MPAPTYWQLRALDLLSGAIDPGRALVGDAARGTRLVDPLDLMMARLWVRMTAETCAPRWVPGAVLAHHRLELRHIFRRRLDRVLVVRGLRSEIVPSAAAAALRGETYALVDVGTGVVAAMRAVRTDKPEVWTGGKWSKVQDVETVPSSSVAVTAPPVVAEKRDGADGCARG